MKARKFSSKVINGKLDRIVSRQIADYLTIFEGKNISVEIKEFSKTRSTPQNDYYWGVVIELYLKGALDMGDTDIADYVKLNRLTSKGAFAQATHEILLSEFAGREQINIYTGEIIYLPNSTTKMTTNEFMLYVELIRTAAIDRWEMEIPLPPERD